MSRLTTNKPADEMSMLELAYNSCYAKDGKARYRDFEQDIDARELIADLLRIHEGMEISFKTAEEFDEWMIDFLQEDMGSTEGLLALFYRNLWAMADMRETLKSYEDKEEKGLLKTFPCGIGADIYSIPSETHFRLNILHGHGELNRVYHQRVFGITIHDKGWYMEGDKDHEYGTSRLFLDIFYGVTWFTTEAEAEEALARMKGE